MKRLLLIGFIALALTACDKKEPEAGTTAQGTTAATAAQVDEPDEPAEPAEDPSAADGEKVEVAAAGTKFDPPIEPAKLPDGVWYCDMGTVHYARAEKGDGTCEICGMQLKEKGAAAAEEGHGHGEEGHDHGEGADHAH